MVFADAIAHPRLTSCHKPRHLGASLKRNIQRWSLAASGGLVFALALWLGWIPHSLDILVGDDYAWYQSLYLMHDAVIGTAPRSEIFSNTFYGWPFWLLTFLVGLPFYEAGWENEAGVIIASRAVEALFAGLNAALILACLYRASRDRFGNKQTAWLLLAIPLLMLMPIWWEMATRIHPQQMLLFFELGAVYALLCDEGSVGRHFWFAVASASIAFAIKIEAAMLAPLFLFYLSASAYCGRAQFGKAARAVIFALPMPIIVLFLLNPYMFSGAGLASWMRSNFQNLSEVNSSGHSGHGDIFSRLDLIAGNFYSLPVLLFLLTVLAVDAAMTLRRRRFEASQWLFPYIGVVLVFAIFVLTGKNYAYYWLAPMVLLLHGLVPLAAWLVRKPVLLGGVAGLMLLSGLFRQMPATASVMRYRAADQVYSAMQGGWVDLSSAKHTAAAQAKALAMELGHSRRPLISPYTDISFRELGIRYIDRIYGCLSAEVLGPTQGRIPKPAADLVILRRNDPVLACDLATLSRWHFHGMTFGLVRQTPYLQVYALRRT